MITSSLGKTCEMDQEMYHREKEEKEFMIE
jgi:hypothetical protein